MIKMSCMLIFTSINFDPKGIEEFAKTENNSSEIKELIKVLLVIVKSEKDDYSWANAKKMLSKPDAVITLLTDFPFEKAQDWQIKTVGNLIQSMPHDANIYA